VTPGLFKKYPTIRDFAAANQEEMSREIRSTGFFNNKAKSVIGAARKILADYGGEVPRDIDSLLSVPGAARKTANVVLGNAFGVPGITVDTHFGRLSRRFGWTSETDPDKVELDVGALFPRKDWTQLSHNVIWHGRRRCHARNPACGACQVARLCPAYGEGETDPARAAKLVREPRG
jgi:endonuclease-3